VLARWNPWAELEQLERQMADLSRRTFVGGRRGEGEQTIVPAVDVFSRNGDLVVRAELPGIDPERDVDVSVQDGVLVIRGERRVQDRTEAKDYVRMESVYGAFQRSIPLPAGVKEEDIKASYDNGFLEVVVPKGGQAKSHKKIAVSAGGKLKAVGSGPGQKKK
jgi:HSP20 family protein